jgi:hypothetical protein
MASVKLVAILILAMHFVLFFSEDEGSRLPPSLPPKGECYMGTFARYSKARC